MALLDWIFQGLCNLVIAAACGVLAMALIALLVTAAPGAVMFFYQDKIVSRFCPQYRRPEPGRLEEQ